MNHSTTRISPAKMNNLAESQQKVEEVCQMYFMKLRSGLIIGNRTCYFRRKTIKRHPPKPARKYDKQHLVFTPYQQAPERSSENVASDAQPHNRRSCSEDSYSLSTYNDQSVTFAFADGGYEIYVEDLGKKQEKDKVLFRYHGSQSPISPRGDVVDGERLMVSLSPSKDKDFLLHANNQEHSVELQKCENPLPDQTFFFLHTEPGSSTYVSFECKSNPGVFIGVKDNQLALIQLKDQTEHSRRENIKFKLS
ncbi:interleukin-33 isoform X2 [Sturnira hondurensis]|uniref:interleukin-33 isoform X2 n=1 Tax=Sturnira hondurensis TaxID=192404 RepID=UPI00187A9E37|nr:interleukin-33 isoform X2 [Sturnira hondurensis]XP_036917302.1 interleukin-33 isoform X2 [Sturnira hondurensis]XP_036917303.1 interleukin-33 isoform X2 [Sturnira hondurensis]